MNVKKSNMEFVWTLWDIFNKKFIEYWRDNKLKDEGDLKIDCFNAAYDGLLEFVITSLIEGMIERDINADKIIKDVYDNKIEPEFDRILTENIQEVIRDKE